LWVHRDGAEYVVEYAIADASWFVRPGHPLWDEALKRGSSYYLPGLVIPMLPRTLSEGVVSLNPGVDRRALVFRMRLAEDGECTSTEIFRARIHSRAKLSFEEVQALYDSESHPLELEPYARSLQALKEVGVLRMERAEERGVVSFRRTEVNVTLSEEKGFVAVRELRLPVERYNEQISLLCNVEGARFLRQGDTAADAVDPIYRTHEGPDEERLSAFERLVKSFVASRKLPQKPWAWDRKDARSLSEYLESLPASGPEQRLALAIHRQALFVSGRSAFSAEPAAHFGVGADVYGRFTAPMREIVGVFVHGETLEALAGKKLTEPGAPSGPQLRSAVLEAANRSKNLQKQLTRATNEEVLDELFSSAGDTEFTGTVMGCTSEKLHVLLEEPPVDVKLYGRHLAKALGRKLAASDEGAELRDESGRVLCRLGDHVRVRVLGRDERAGRWQLSLSSVEAE
jgi:ribonuclease R